VSRKRRKQESSTQRTNTPPQGSSTQKSNKPLYISLSVIFIALVILSYYTYYGLFDPVVKYSSFEMGNLYSEFMGPGDHDYILNVKYTSKGAFVAGRKIDVSVDLLITKRLAGNLTAMKELANATFVVIFPGATPYSLPKELPTSPISADIPSSSDLDAAVELHLDNKTSAHGETELVYFMPELNSEPAIAPFKTNGIYTYNLFITDDAGHLLDLQTSAKLIRRNAFLFIAPLETTLTLRNSNLILILTFAAIYVAIVPIAIELQRMRRKAS